MKVIAAFEEAAGKLPRSQARVADFIAKHPAEVAFMTIEQLSHEVGVSTTTVMRLAASLNYEGYTEMIQPFKENLLQESTPLSKFVSASEKGKGEKFAANFVEIETRMLNETINGCDFSQIDKAVSLIEGAQKVYFIGYRMSYMTMAYLYQCMHRIKDNCLLIEPGGFDLIENISMISKDDVVIGCVLPRYYSLVPDVIKTAKQRGAKTIVLTDSYNSPVSSDADVLLMCNCEGASFHVSILGTIFVADYISALLAKRNPNATGDKLSKTETVFEEYRRKLV